MPLAQSFTPGRVDWTGENPGIVLVDAAGKPTAMALFFRIVWSPVGRGTVLMLYGSPDSVEGTEAAPNVLVSDNPRLSEFLRTGFLADLEDFANCPAYRGLAHRDLETCRTSGDPTGTRYVETVSSRGLVVELVWEGLEEPKALELPPALTGTGAHTMFSLLVPAQRGRIIVNGRDLPGATGSRVQAGFETTTAFLYFSETWILPPAA